MAGTEVQGTQLAIRSHGMLYKRALAPGTFGYRKHIDISVNGSNPIYLCVRVEVSCLPCTKKTAVPSNGRFRRILSFFPLVTPD